MKDYTHCKHELFNTLRGGSRARLAAMRDYVKTWNDNPRCVTQLNSWKQARSHGTGTILTDAHAPMFRAGYANLPASMLAGLRDVGDASDIVSLRHTGWYRDAHGDESYSGHVWQLPARNGEPQFIAGYIDECAEYAVLDATGHAFTLYDDKDDAARAADHVAEWHAERDREHDEKWQEASQHDSERIDARNELHGARQDAGIVLAAWRDQRATGALAPSVCELLRERLQTARDQMHAAIEKIHEENDAIEDLGMTGEF